MIDRIRIRSRKSRYHAHPPICGIGAGCSGARHTARGADRIIGRHQPVDAHHELRTR